MGCRSGILLVTLSTLFFMIHALDGGPYAGQRDLLQESFVENFAESPAGKEPAFRGGEVVSETPTASESRKMGNHRMEDNSAAGGGVIIGGLVSAIFAAVYCYIRVTRRRAFQQDA